MRDSSVMPTPMPQWAGGGGTGTDSAGGGTSASGPWLPVVEGECGAMPFERVVHPDPPVLPEMFDSFSQPSHRADTIPSALPVQPDLYVPPRHPPVRPEIPKYGSTDTGPQGKETKKSRTKADPAVPNPFTFIPPPPSHPTQGFAFADPSLSHPDPVSHVATVPLSLSLDLVDNGTGGGRCFTGTYPRQQRLPMCAFQGMTCMDDPQRSPLDAYSGLTVQDSVLHSQAAQSVDSRMDLGLQGHDAGA
ncbi:hypothetical protein KIPB_010190 [Kipferlia bialata]|uniref:Uncharacterized protein n=1 Tax=Kipferlia bialata TaxID=797122 RepID=A0A9K3GMN4_9EUKA|nr:hypothetical protein KIPB_010190 [Kipferlia bialata]|eukprot:g10190.t1